MLKMIKQNRSKFEVRSSCQGSPHAWNEAPSMQSKRKGPSISSKTKVNANKYSNISNANHTFINDNYTYNKYSISTANHTLIKDNHTYNVYKCTIYDDCTSMNDDENSRQINEDKGFYGSYMYDNDNYSMYVNGKDKFNNEEYDRGSEDSFTFSSVAESMEFFNFKSSSEAEASMPSMSPADELFQDGKIRPLIQPIINGLDQFQHCKIQPLIQPLINGHNDSKTQPSIQPLINGHDLPMNPLLDQHASFSELAAHYLVSANHGVIQQEFHVEKLHNSQDLLLQGELDHGLSTEINQKLLHQRDLDHGLSTEINQNLKEQPNYGGLPLQILTLSAPTSPVKEILANEQNDNQGSHQFYSVISTSQINCYRRCRSLSRVFQFEDNEQILEVQLDLVEDGRKGSGFLNYKRKTLQDLFTQEGKPISMPEMIKEPYKMVKEKQLGLANPNRNAKNFYDAERRPSLAPAPINIPHLWPIREKLSAAPTTNGKSSNKVGTPSPHELHYASQKAQSHRLKKKTFLPYRPGLLGCLGYPPH